ncbi:hydrolase/acyltransferase [Melampsora americana]|nr:hydrolase/acyltransferase [Melampsora americana]
MNVLDQSQICYCKLPSGHLIAYQVLKPRNQTSERKNTPLILIHGLSGVGLIDWSPFSESLSYDRTVVVFDNRDIGWSRPPKGRENEPLTLDDMGNDTIELIKHLQFESVDLLGFSMGGTILQHILMKSTKLPFRIKHAILASTFAVSPDMSDLGMFFPQEGGDETKTAEERKYEFTKKLMEAQYDDDWLTKNVEMLDHRVRTSLLAKRPGAVIMRQAMACQGLDLRAGLLNISPTIPILSLHGTKDKIVGFKEQAKILESIPHAQKAKVPDLKFGREYKKMINYYVMKILVE